MTSSSPCDPPGASSYAPPPESPRGRWPARVRWRRVPLPDRRAVRLGVLLLLAGTTAVALSRAGVPATAPTADDRGRASYVAAPDGPERPSAYPRVGAGSFTTAPGDSPVRGTDGPLLRYRVAVEQDAGQDAAAFAAAVDGVLADPRSWIASEWLRVQRVAEAADADFTVYLATPDTSERMCAEGGLSTDGYTSCRLPGRVVVNLARWLEAVPDYGAPLEVYRAYLVNHEVGHELGEVHQACPGPGEPAPVMQQQTYGLDGCAANAWPYVDGSRYDGEVVRGI
ncbi:DUF3152 domain-containing protein [Micromonospora sp. CPCC 205561]|uniref:DUF3152 domain-containing protein n=1 Tax=Micromonospora sp. CPCC 205561 TaxID=3122407 RepID=UPI002FF24271